MILTHFSRVPLEFSYFKKYSNGIEFFKPRGLWLSDENNYGWKQWCIENDFCVDHLTCRTEFECDTTTTWIVLDSDSKILEFTKRYQSSQFSFGIDWSLVKRDFDGILISPYSYNLRLHPNTTWACVWNLGTVRPVGYAKPSIQDVYTTGTNIL